MPNLKPPVAEIADAVAYRQRILAAIPTNYNFTPLMTLYLTDKTSAKTIKDAKESGIIYGCKLYPAGATTHSDQGIAKLEKIYPVLEVMEAENLVLQIHGEVTDADIDIFDREKYFIDRHLVSLIKAFPKLRMVLEHVSTKEGIEIVEQSSDNVGATITAHHLLLNRNDLFKGGINPHHFCLPILKRTIHQEALIKAATSGNAKFFLGTDSAPHAQNQKECSYGCAGIFTSHVALEVYAEVFSQAESLDKLEGFASFYGADFYGLARNQEKITLVRESWQAPRSVVYGEEELIPFRAGGEINWKVLRG